MSVTKEQEQVEFERPPTWEGINKDAKPGTTLKGTLKDVRVAKSEYGEFYVCDVEGPDGLVSVPAYHTVLGNQLDEVRPQIGEEITIEFVGPAVAASGRRYRDYNVNGGVGKGLRRPDWLQKQDPAEPPIAPSTVAGEATAEVVARDAQATTGADDDDSDLPF